MDDLREKIRQELEQPILVGYRWATLLLGFYMLFLIPLYLVFERGMAGYIQSLCSLSAAIVLFTCHGLLRRRQTSTLHTQRLVAAGAGAILAQILVHLSLRGSLILTTDVMLLAVSTALLFRDTRWFLVGLGITLASWASVVAFNPLSGDLVHWIVGMATAAIVAVVLHLYLHKVHQTQEELRYQGHKREQEMERLNGQLSESFENIRTLEGLISICANCKKIRDDQGFWQQIEHYLKEHAGADFTHGICPDCAEVMRAEFRRHSSDG